jgi:hypothetical protein
MRCLPNFVIDFRSAKRTNHEQYGIIKNRRAIMFERASQDDLDRYDRAVDSAIATCGGDLRGALKALIIANEYLEEELRRQIGDAEPQQFVAPERNVA